MNASTCRAAAVAVASSALLALGAQPAVARADEHRLTIAVHGAGAIMDPFSMFRSLPELAGRQPDTLVLASAGGGLELGWRIHPAVALGVYAEQSVAAVRVLGGAQFDGEALTGLSCGRELSCSGSMLRAGVEAIWQPRREVVAPWASLGLGVSRTVVDAVPRAGFDARALHVERLTPDLLVRVGGEVRVADWLGVGPYVGVAVPAPAEPSFELGLRLSFDAL